MKNNKVAIILGVVCVLLTYAICVQIKTVKEMTEDIGSPLRENSELKAEYVKWKGEYEGSQTRLREKEEKLERTRKQASLNNQGDTEKGEELEKNNSLLGLTEVRGNGVTILVDDNRDINSTEVSNISDYIVHEGDVLTIVNELFNAGADAVSVNGQRIVSTTAIVCDGNIIRINNEKIGVPIVIRAIGYTENLLYALERPGGYLEGMRNDGVKVLSHKEDNVTIPKFSGVYNYEYMVRGE